MCPKTLHIATLWNDRFYVVYKESDWERGEGGGHTYNHCVGNAAI